MQLFKLEMAWNNDVRKWIETTFDLNPQQRRKLYDDYNDVLRSAPFYFCVKAKESKRKGVKNLLWRTTIILIPPYVLLAFAFSFVQWLATGQSKLPDKFIFNFHNKWMNKLGINL